MLGRYFHQFGKKVASKCVKWFLIVVVAYITWISFIGEQLKSTGQRLYNQGQQLYMEAKRSPLPPATKDSDSILIKHTERSKHYE